MTGPSYLSALHTLGLTPETAAPWLGVGRSTAYRYAQTGPIEPVARMIEMAVRVRAVDRMKVWDFTYMHEPTVQMAKEDPEGYWVRHSDLTAAVGLGG